VTPPDPHLPDADTTPDAPPATLDPVATNPAHYRVLFENEVVRVLEYADGPGDRTTPHDHPDSVMVTLSGFQRRLYAADGRSRDVQMPAGLVGWLPAQRHSGHNVGDTETRVIFVELLGSATGGDPTRATLGPTEPRQERP
jgi:hypothetical protein